MLRLKDQVIRTSVSHDREEWFLVKISARNYYVILQISSSQFTCLNLA